MPPRNASLTRISRRCYRSGSARDSVDPAGVARAVTKLEWTECLAQCSAHPRLRLLDQNRTDIHAFARHHAAARALQHRRFFVAERLRVEALPLFVRAGPCFSVASRMASMSRFMNGSPPVK